MKPRTVAVAGLALAVAAGAVLAALGLAAALRDAETLLDNFPGFDDEADNLSAAEENAVPGGSTIKEKH